IVLRDVGLQELVVGGFLDVDEVGHLDDTGDPSQVLADAEVGLDSGRHRCSLGLSGAVLRGATSLVAAASSGLGRSGSCGGRAVREGEVERSEGVPRLRQEEVGTRNALWAEWRDLSLHRPAASTKTLRSQSLLASSRETTGIKVSRRLAV